MYVDPDVDAVYRVLDLTGVFINGVIGGTIARQKRFDLIGFGFLALISALGGGLLRDVFMQKGTPTAFAEPIYVGCALLGGLIAWLAHLQGRIWRIIFGGNTMYATPALLGATIMTAFHQLGLPGTAGMLVAAITSSGIAILAAWRKWSLPQSSDTAPITMTRMQLRKMLARRERIGKERERRRWRRAQDDDPGIESPEPVQE